MKERTLAACQAKLERANEHVKYLHTTLLPALMKDGHYGITTERDKATGEQVIHAHFPLAVRSQVAVIVGEIVHDLRSALDHMAFALATTRTRGYKSAFPICGSVTEYADKLPVWLGGVSKDAETIIERLQPYHAGNAMTDQMLWVLNELSNRDKHRLLNLGILNIAAQRVRVVPEGTPMGFDAEELLSSVPQSSAGPFEDGAEMYRFDPKPQSGMEVRYETALEVAFEQSGPGKGRSVVLLCSDLVSETQRVLQLLAPFLR